MDNADAMDFTDDRAELGTTAPTTTDEAVDGRRDEDDAAAAPPTGGGMREPLSGTVGRGAILADAGRLGWRRPDDTTRGTRVRHYRRCPF